MEKVRLNKFLAQCGICSRRDADKLIAEGRVTINGSVAGIGSQVGGTDSVAVDGKQLQGREERVVLAYYKPFGVICTERDKFAERIVTKEIGYPARVTYAGRLDKESEGLLLLSNDGDLIQRMMKGSGGHEKEYVVKLRQELTDDFLKQMASGVYLHELERKTRPCRVEKVGKYTFRIILTQGMNRQIRRMCSEFGMEVAALKRVRVMNITLGELKPCKYRKLEGEELEQLYRLAETKGKETWSLKK